MLTITPRVVMIDLYSAIQQQQYPRSTARSHNTRLRLLALTPTCQVSGMFTSRMPLSVVVVVVVITF